MHATLRALTLLAVLLGGALPAFASAEGGDSTLSTAGGRSPPYATNGQPLNGLGPNPGGDGGTGVRGHAGPGLTTAPRARPGDRVSAAPVR